MPVGAELEDVAVHVEEPQGVRSLGPDRVERPAGVGRVPGVRREAGLVEDAEAPLARRPRDAGELPLRLRRQRVGVARGKRVPRTREGRQAESIDISCWLCYIVCL